MYRKECKNSIYNYSRLLTHYGVSFLSLDTLTYLPFLLYSGTYVDSNVPKVNMIVKTGTVKTCCHQRPFKKKVVPYFLYFETTYVPNLQHIIYSTSAFDFFNFYGKKRKIIMT